MSARWRLSPRELLRRLEPQSLRFWAVVLPIHLTAFALLYLGTHRLLDYAYSHAAAAAARRQLDNAVREMPFIAPASPATASPHIFGHLLAAHRPIGLKLYRSNGALIGTSGGAPDPDELRRVRILLSDERSPNEVWVEESDGRDWVRGVVRLGEDAACHPCHQTGQTLGAATMKINLTEEFASIRQMLRQRIGLLLGLWMLVISATAMGVQLTVRRSMRRLEDDLAAAAAGRDQTDEQSRLVLDPVTAKIYERLREFLRRSRAREAEVASRLAHVDQLATLGQLSAGLAHEIKNPLAGIQGAIEVLREEAPDAATGVVYDEILGELKRVNGILQRLLESGRLAPLRLSRTDIGRLVVDTVELMQPALRRKKVDLRCEVAAGLPEALVDPAKIRQVLLNLLQNAGEAMGEKGCHVVVRASSLAQDGGVVIAVEDDGPGIAGENLGRLFEPFFTTKFTGTGLGLTISKGLIEQHGGRIEIDSEEGRGTTFFLFLPSDGAQARSPAAGPEA